jgi:hypothetical protein
MRIPEQNEWRASAIRLGARSATAVWAYTPFTLIVEKRLVSLFGAHNRLRPPFGWKHSDSQSERHQIGARGL